ncbi:unnamed protein product, partial [Angiostrongylus costaricensis]|uniref:MAM domain-containing protein n=1 Tax=Angiostrongylus costaricensis TaxID=334426 RepID=A0A0R3PY92_ANGCS
AALGASSLPPISDASELSCFQFDPTCRWRNLEGLFVDEMDWFQGSGALDEHRMHVATGTHIIPDGMYAIVATDAVQLPTAKAILASDQIMCQIGPGQLRFKYWSSPEVRLRVCAKKISKTFPEYDFCSSDIETGDPGPVYVTISKESSTPFQLFIIAEHFVFHSIDLQGGFAIIDDIEYTAELCDKEASTGENSVEHFYDFTSRMCFMTCIVRASQIRFLFEQTAFKFTIFKDSKQKTGLIGPLRNSFLIPMTNSSLHLHTLTTDGFPINRAEHFSYATASSWIISSHPVGNPLTGIRGDASKLPFNESGSFAFVSGPVDFSRLSTPSFYLDRKVYFIFSYHKVDRKSLFRLYTKRKDTKEEEMIFEVSSLNRRIISPSISVSTLQIAFEVRNLMANNYIGVDELMLVDTMRLPFCKT